MPGALLCGLKRKLSQPLHSTITELTAFERRILKLLRDAASCEGATTEVRIAGGWVRDKLLRLSNHDIDIAVSRSSSEFAALLNRQLASEGVSTHTIAVIEQNTEQFKRTETSRIRVDSSWIDIVTLLSTHSDPTECARDDALSRDFTINSLFYNVLSGTVEDLTGKGLSDLRSRTINTPVLPESTLEHDPLRCYRAIRFACRYDFTIHPDVWSAIRSNPIQKVSLERIASEVGLILSGNNPSRASTLLMESCLLPRLFSFEIPMDRFLYYRDRVSSLLNLFPDAQIPSLSSLSLSRVNINNDRSFHSPISVLYFLCTIGEHLKSIPARYLTKNLTVIVEKELGFAKQETSLLHRLLLCSEKMYALSRELSRKDLGWCITEGRSDWPLAVFVSMVLWDSDSDLVSVMKRHGQLFVKAREWGVEEIYDRKPPLNGTQLMNLGVGRGPEIKEYVQMVWEWFILHTDRPASECAEFIQSHLTAAC